MDFSDIDILVIGSVNMDIVLRVPRIPQEGESLIASSMAYVPGGKGGNQAVAAARLGGRVTFAGAVGDDAFGRTQRANFAAEGILLDYLSVDAREATGTAVIMVSDLGQNSIVVAAGANNEVGLKDIAALEETIARSDVVLLQLEIPVGSVIRALELAKKHGVLSVLDCGPAQSTQAALMRLADVVSPNATEAEVMTGLVVGGLDGAREASRMLHKNGAREVVMKLGVLGALYSHANGRDAYAPAFPVKVTDTTAAGDAFTAAFALGMAANEANIEEVLRFACGAGAFAATVAGAQPSMPTMSDVLGILATEK